MAAGSIFTHHYGQISLDDETISSQCQPRIDNAYPSHPQLNIRNWLEQNGTFFFFLRPN